MFCTLNYVYKTTSQNTRNDILYIKRLHLLHKLWSKESITKWNCHNWLTAIYVVSPIQPPPYGSPIRNWRGLDLCDAEMLFGLGVTANTAFDDLAERLAHVSQERFVDVVIEVLKGHLLGFDAAHKPLVVLAGVWGECGV